MTRSTESMLKLESRCGRTVAEQMEILTRALEIYITKFIYLFHYARITPLGQNNSATLRERQCHGTHLDHTRSGRCICRFTRRTFESHFLAFLLFLVSCGRSVLLFDRRISFAKIKFYVWYFRFCQPCSQREGVFSHFHIG